MQSKTTASHFRPQKILLPIDFSPSSTAAMETGREMAQHYNAEIILLTVIPMFSTSRVSDEFIPTLSPDSIKREDLDELSQAASEMASQGIKATSRTEVGEDIVANIMLTVKNENIDLVIISTHGKTGWREGIFGSIAEKVVQQIDCPLLLLRSVKPTANIDHVQGDTLRAPAFDLTSA